MNNQVEIAISFARDNKEAICKSSSCGCYYCCEVFHPREIKEYVDKNGETAICPKCGVDSVLPSSVSLITSEFLKQMNNRWFSSKT